MKQNRPSPRASVPAVSKLLYKLFDRLLEWTAFCPRQDRSRNIRRKSAPALLPELLELGRENENAKSPDHYRSAPIPPRPGEMHPSQLVSPFRRETAPHTHTPP